MSRDNVLGREIPLPNSVGKLLILSESFKKASKPSS